MRAKEAKTTALDTYLMGVIELLRAKKGLIEPLHGLFVHAPPGVRYNHLHHSSLFAGSRINAHGPLVLNRLNRVYDKICQNLSYRIGGELYAAEVRLATPGYRHPLSVQCPLDLSDTGDDLVNRVTGAFCSTLRSHHALGELCALLDRLLNEGKTDREIVDFMVARYGEYVLYEPPLEAKTVLLWAAPVLMLCGGLLVLAGIVRRARRAGTARAAALSEAERSRLDELLHDDGTQP